VYAEDGSALVAGHSPFVTDGTREKGVGMPGRHETLAAGERGRTRLAAQHDASNECLSIGMST
jgi:hypothetical protein